MYIPLRVCTRVYIPLRVGNLLVGYTSGEVTSWLGIPQGVYQGELYLRVCTREGYTSGCDRLGIPQGVTGWVYLSVLISEAHSTTPSLLPV